MYGFVEFWNYYMIVDLVYISFVILMNFSLTFSRNTHFESLNKSMWENDFNNEKFRSMFKNLVTPIIKINKDNYIIEFNDIFKEFLEKISVIWKDS